MPVNAGIFNALAGPPKSVQDYMAAYDQQDMRKQQMQQNALALQGMQATQADQARARQEADQLRNALAWLGGTATDEQRIQALKGTGLPGGFSQADALEKSILERQKIQAGIGKDAAATAKDQYALTRQKLEHGVMGLQVAQSPAQAVAMFQDGVQKGYWSMQDAQRQMQTIPQDPAQFMTWRQQQLAQILDAEKQLPKLIDTDQGGTRLFGARDPITGALRVNSSQPITQSANNAAQVGATIRGQDVSAATQRRGQDLTDARSRESNSVARDAIGKVEWKQDADGNWLALPKEVKNGQPVVPVTTTAPGKREMQAGHALDIIAEARGLIEKGTSSYAGAAVDQAARVFGASTPGSEAGAKLKALEGALMMAQPRMEGPQSDKDVALYKQMAGQIGDPTVPAKNKAAALDAIDALHRKYTNGADAPKPGTPKAGDVVDGYRFKGGDPSKQGNWEKR